MKQLILSALFAPALMASETPTQCLKDYDLIRYQSQKREIISTLEVEVEHINLTLGDLQKKASSHYMNLLEIEGEETLTIQTAIYRDKKDSQKINGYRIRLDSAYHDEDIVSYYYSASKRLMKTYHDGQSPYSEWECEGYKTQQDFIDDKIKEIAKETEYSYGDFSEYKEIESVQFSKLPSHIQKKAEELRDDIIDMGGGAFIETDTLYTISIDGKVIGYIIHIHDIIDHSLWDGSGAYHFLNLKGKELATNTWEG